MLRHVADDDIDFDETGLLRTALPGALIAARVIDEPLFVRIWVLVLSEVPEDDDLAARLGELSGRLRLATLTTHDGMVLAQVEGLPVRVPTRRPRRRRAALDGAAGGAPAAGRSSAAGTPAASWTPPPNGPDPGAYL